MPVGDLWREVFGEHLPRGAERFFRSREEKDFVLWTSKRVNIPVIIEAVQPLIVRHNDPEELFTLDVDVPGRGLETVPAILGTKIAGELRRRMQQLLRDAYKLWPGEVDQALESVGEKGYGGSYECGVRVYVQRGSERAEAGYCKRCPACALMGYAVEGGGEINSISRVDKDTFYAAKRLVDAMIKITRNKVDDVAFITGQALFEVNAVRPGTLFLGVIVLRDVTEAETIFALKALSEMERIGAVKTIFGGIRTHIPLVAFAEGRLLTGYELAGEALAAGKTSKEDLKSFVVEKFEAAAKSGAAIVSTADYSGILRERSVESMKEVFIEAWKDAGKRRILARKLAGVS